MISPEWQITYWYLLILAAVVLAAKIASLLQAGQPLSARVSFFFVPSLSWPAWHNKGYVERKERLPIVFRSIATLSLMCIFYQYVKPLWEDKPLWLQGYCSVVPFWLLIETIEALCCMLWMVVNIKIPPINNCILLSGSLSDFWGKRWNLLFGNWIRQVVFLPLSRKPKWALLISFVTSGLLHELIVSVPLYLVYGEHVWGWMVGYFLIQYLGILFERKCLPENTLVKRGYTWFLVIGPSPLILNSGTLRIFHLTS